MDRRWLPMYANPDAPTPIDPRRCGATAFHRFKVTPAHARRFRSASTIVLNDLLWENFAILRGNVDGLFLLFLLLFFFWEFCGEAEGMLNGSTKGWFMLGEEWRGNENCINTCTMVEVGYRLDSLLILCNYSNWEYLDNLLGYSLLPSELYKYLGDRNWLRSWFEFVGNSLGFVEIEGGWSVMRNRNCTNIRVTVEIACCLNSLKILIRNRGDSSVVQWMARE